ncbi:MAG: hypothetical protein AAFP76_10345 [Bacteroidota bacterium]
MKEKTSSAWQRISFCFSSLLKASFQVSSINQMAGITFGESLLQHFDRKSLIRLAADLFCSPHLIEVNFVKFVKQKNRISRFGFFSSVLKAGLEPARP